MRRALPIAVLALAGACTPDFDDESTVKDLRVLGISAEPPEVLFDGGPLSRQAELCLRQDVLMGLATELAMNLPQEPRMITLRPLVVDPRGGGRPVHYRAVACVSPVERQGGGGNMMPGGVRETIGRGACPDDAPLLAEGDVAPPPGSMTPEITVPLTLTPQLLIPALNADLLGLVYGLALTVQVTVSAGEERVVARKRVLASTRLSSAHVANQNPLIPGVTWRRPKSEGDLPVGEEGTPWDAASPPEVRLGERLQIQPASGIKESYPARIGDRYTGCVTIKDSTEALRFAFFASVGGFSPHTTNTEASIIRGPANDPHKLASTYEAPKALEPGESEFVRIWIVTRDERAGSSFIELPLKLVP